MTMVLSVIIGVVCFTLGAGFLLVLNDNLKRARTTTAIREVEMSMERYTEQMLEKSFVKLNEWQKNMMNGFEKDED